MSENTYSTGTVVKFISPVVASPLGSIKVPHGKTTRLVEAYLIKGTVRPVPYVDTLVQGNFVVFSDVSSTHKRASIYLLDKLSVGMFYFKIGYNLEITDTSVLEPVGYIADQRKFPIEAQQHIRSQAYLKSALGTEYPKLSLQEDSANDIDVIRRNYFRVFGQDTHTILHYINALCSGCGTRLTKNKNGVIRLPKRGKFRNKLDYICTNACAHAIFPNAVVCHACGLISILMSPINDKTNFCICRSIRP